MGDEVPTDDQIDDMARAVHEQYLLDNAGDPGHAAMVPWGELDPLRRSQNHDQVLMTIQALRDAGFGLARAGSVPTDAAMTSLADDVVESMARDEHDRWCQKKRAAGYRYGPTTKDKGDDLRHENLVAWADLSPADREKDRRPIADFPRILGIGGWVLTEPVD